MKGDVFDCFKKAIFFLFLWTKLTHIQGRISEGLVVSLHPQQAPKGYLVCEEQGSYWSYWLITHSFCLLLLCTRFLGTVKQQMRFNLPQFTLLCCQLEDASLSFPAMVSFLLHDLCCFLTALLLPLTDLDVHHLHGSLACGGKPDKLWAIVTTYFLGMF